MLTHPALNFAATDELSAFIENNLDQIIHEWRLFARSISPGTEAMSSLALDDHAQEMLLAIVKDMNAIQPEEERSIRSKGKAPNAPSALETAAFTHGVTRHLSRFDIDQVVSEFRALQASVLALWRQSEAVRTGEAAVEEIARFNEGVDQVLTESVLSYSARVVHSRDMFLAVLGHDVRGPLSGIDMAADLLESPTLTEPVRLQIAPRIRRGARMIGRLTTTCSNPRAAGWAPACPSSGPTATFSMSARKRSTPSERCTPTKQSARSSLAICVRNATSRENAAGARQSAEQRRPAWGPQPPDLGPRATRGRRDRPGSRTKASRFPKRLSPGSSSRCSDFHPRKASPTR